MKRVREDIRNGEFAQCYVFCGDEPYAMTHGAAMLRDAILPADDAMNRHHYFGPHVDISSIISIGSTLPFFAEHRLIELERTGYLKKSTPELAEFLKEMPSYLTVVFIEDEIDKRNGTYKQAATYERIIECKKMNETRLASWAAAVLGKAGKKIRTVDMQYFLECVGNDMFTIDRELEKLIAYTDGREVVERADMEAITTVSLDNRVYDMIRAVAEGRRADVARLYADLLSLRERPQSILSKLTRQYRQMYQVARYHAAGMAPSRIAEMTSMPAFAVRRTIGLLSSYREEEIREAIASCADAEETYKSGRGDDQILTEMLLVQLSDRGA